MDDILKKHEFVEDRKMNVGIDKVVYYRNLGYRVYIYGVGLWGRNVYHELKANCIEPDGFVVTKIDSVNTLFGLSVQEYFDLTDDKIILILGLNQHNTRVVCSFLKEQGFEEEKIIYANDIMGMNDTRCGYDEIPCLDITTKIGCSINCKYCPQDVLIREYFKRGANRETYLNTDTLIRCMEHMPDDTNYQFGGMSEPFLNPQCLDLIRAVCDRKHTVNLYTTLVGLDEETLYEIMELPIGFVTLHVADARRYAKIPLTEQYYRLLEIAVNYRRKDGTPFVNMCNAQAEPDMRVSQICGERFAVSSTLLDRAGNLKGEELVSKHVDKGRISCGVCGKALNKNELLPDGTLLLCCMDYGMKHILGNLNEQTYDEITGGAEIRNIRRGMEHEFGLNILCRSCSCAYLVE